MIEKMTNWRKKIWIISLAIICISFFICIFIPKEIVKESKIIQHIYNIISKLDDYDFNSYCEHGEKI